MRWRCLAATATFASPSTAPSATSIARARLARSSSAPLAASQAEPDPADTLSDLRLARLVRLVPVLAAAGLDDEWDGERAARRAGAFHHPLDDPCGVVCRGFRNF